MSNFDGNNIIIVVGDLGSGANFVKNLLLLDSSTDWPQPNTPENRLNYFVKQIYPEALKHNLTRWSTYEYKLRVWKAKYQVDIADNYFDINTKVVEQTSKNNKIVFLTHWPSIAKSLRALYPRIKIVGIHACTRDEILWQVKTYIDKFGIAHLHNFSFENNIIDQKETYINKHGLDEYYKFNVKNMIHILMDRANDYKFEVGLTVSELLDGNINEIISRLNNHLKLNIDLQDALQLYHKWQGLHNPQNEIYNFKWFED